MPVTDTLKTREAYENAGIPTAQAATMAHMDEQQAGDVADHIRQVFAGDFARIESKIEAGTQRTARDQLK